MKTTFRLVILILFASSCLLSQTIKLDSGLVAYYPLNSSAQDAGPNGLHGTTNAGVSWSFDRFATPSAAALFGGDSALIRIEDDPLIDPPEIFPSASGCAPSSPDSTSPT